MVQEYQISHSECTGQTRIDRDRPGRMFANSIHARAHSHGHAHDCRHAHARGYYHGHKKYIIGNAHG